MITITPEVNVNGPQPSQGCSGVPSKNKTIKQLLMSVSFSLDDEDDSFSEGIYQSGYDLQIAEIRSLILALIQRDLGQESCQRKELADTSEVEYVLKKMIKAPSKNEISIKIIDPDVKSEEIQEIRFSQSYIEEESKQA